MCLFSLYCRQNIYLGQHYIKGNVEAGEALLWHINQLAEKKANADKCIIYIL